jgi:hypothetical protein
MKAFKNITFLFLAISLLALVSCEKQYDTDGLSKITYYPIFTMNGETEYVLSVGDEFVEPGVTAEANGEQITVLSSVTGDYFGNNGPVINTDIPDRYIITYAAENSDGYFGYAERVVYVVSTGDMVNSLEGLYTSTVVRGGVVSPQYADMQYVMIAEISDGVYALSDAIGGYYDIGRAYGGAYRASGLEITANDIATNDFSFNDPITVNPWPEALTIDGMTVDAGAKTIELNSTWDAGYVFQVTLTQVQL